MDRGARHTRGDRRAAAANLPVGDGWRRPRPAAGRHRTRDTAGPAGGGRDHFACRLRAGARARGGPDGGRSLLRDRGGQREGGPGRGGSRTGRRDRRPPRSAGRPARERGAHPPHRRSRAGCRHHHRCRRPHHELEPAGRVPVRLGASGGPRPPAGRGDRAPAIPGRPRAGVGPAPARRPGHRARSPDRVDGARSVPGSGSTFFAVLPRRFTA